MFFMKKVVDIFFDVVCGLLILAGDAKLVE